MAIHNGNKTTLPPAKSSDNEENNSAVPKEEIAMNQSQHEEQPILQNGSLLEGQTEDLVQDIQRSLNDVHVASPLKNQQQKVRKPVTKIRLKKKPTQNVDLVEESQSNGSTTTAEALEEQPNGFVVAAMPLDDHQHQKLVE